MKTENISVSDGFMPADKLHFRRVCGCFPTGVTVATAIGDDGQPHGITLSSFTSVSMEPPLVLVCIDHHSQMIQHLAVNSHFAINVLSNDQQEVSLRFAKQWENRFSGVPWRRGLSGAPLLDDTSAALECRVHQVFAAGDHLIIVGRVLALSYTDRAPLIYLRSSYTTALQSVSATSPELSHSATPGK